MGRLTPDMRRKAGRGAMARGFAVVLGLGLSLCESLAAGMGGALSASNRAPHGATFTLELPLADAR